MALVDAVKGSSAAGRLQFTQIATAGSGGSSDTGAGAAGGGATSSLTVDDTKSSAASASIKAVVKAQAGGGGNGAMGRSGGNANATSAITAAVTGTVTSDTEAVSGSGGLGATSAAPDGRAIATGTATGRIVQMQVSAVGEGGAGRAGVATATGNATGTAGSYFVSAQSDPGTGGLIRSLNALTSGAVRGTSHARASTATGGSVAPYASDMQALSTVTALPNPSDTSAVIGANPHIAAAFTGTPRFIAMGELGALHDDGATGSEQIQAEMILTVDTTKIADPGELILGLYKPTAAGAGISSLLFDVKADGADVATQFFSTTADAVGYFTDHPLDLGNLTSLAGADRLLNLDISFQATTTTGDAGLFGSLILGNSNHVAA